MRFAVAILLVLCYNGVYSLLFPSRREGVGGGSFVVMHEAVLRKIGFLMRQRALVRAALISPEAKEKLFAEIQSQLEAAERELKPVEDELHEHELEPRPFGDQ